MKKVLAVLLALCFVLALVSCSKGDSSSSDTSLGDSGEGFVKPAQYASVLLVTINPQFRLYLDENEKVLAVEAVNQDAESIKDSVIYENESVETVIESILTLSKEKGFLQADVTIRFEMVEGGETAEAADILAKAEKTAQDTAATLEMEIDVQIDGAEPTDDTNATETTPGDGTDPSATADNAGSTTTVSSGSAGTSAAPSSTTQRPATTAHVHSFAAATCTNPKKCTVCGATEGAALGHDYKEGVCTRCGEKDPNYQMTSVLKKQGKWQAEFLRENSDLGSYVSVSLYLCYGEENSISVGYGALFNPEDFPGNPEEVKKTCNFFDGKYWYVGAGDGDNLKSLTEENNVVTVVSEYSDGPLVLSRTGENTLKCTSCADGFFEKIPVGTVFNFVAGD